MTEYGRGQGSEPWHPEDPLYGDGGWGGQQAQEGQQSPYGGQPQHYPEQPQQPQYDNGGWGDGQQAAYGQAQQHDPHQQYQQQYGEQQYQQQYNGQQHNGQQYDQQQYDQQYAAQPQQQYDNGTWGSGTHVQYTDPSDPYGQQNASYGGDQPDYYGTPDAYPPPEPPSRRQAEPEPPRTDWDPGPDQGEHAFFSGADDDDDTDDPRDDRDAPRGRGGKKPKKRRSGCACLVLTVIFAGGVGGVGYFGYQFYQNRFGSAPDFAGDGTGETVPVSVPTGAGGAEIGRLLKAAGVVKSVDAFVSAFAQNNESAKIQAGSYLLNKEMSAESAVELMLDPKSQNNLIVSEGQRNSAVYAEIDKRLELAKGTTAKAAKEKYKDLGLPDWALDQPNLKDPLEGFLYPSAYAASKGEKPESVLKDMVSRATAKYEELGLEKKAENLGLDGPWQQIGRAHV